MKELFESNSEKRGMKYNEENIGIKRDWESKYQSIVNNSEDDKTVSELSNGVKLSPAACDILIKGITEENFQQCLQLKASVPDSQFVDTVEYSLAEAWLYYKDMKPFAIYLGSNIIGFVSMYIGEENYQIINFLIDDMYRGAGIGTKAARICIDYLSKKYGAKRISVPVHERHLAACKFWKKLGFGLSDSIEDGYIYMRLEL